ncbi:SDR family oxidoreductase [Candidatus Woesearchaeota archaeon]|nr:SDR family oxidoreductase [Candidatus Woesearchaeota archaeon]
MFDLTGKISIIFGGNGRLGRQFCKALLEQGSKVYCCDINEQKNEEIIRMEKDHPDSFLMKRVDSTNKQELISLREEIRKKEGRVDVIINATTIKSDDFYLPFEEVSEEGWDIGIKGNLTAPFLAIQAFVPLMKQQRYGSIINISSHYGIVGNDQRIYEGTELHKVYVKKSPNIKRIYSHGVYNAAKAGLINFTRYLAAYYGEYNIRCNCISPGGIYHKDEDKRFLKKYSLKVPLGRKANINEMDGALIYLASDASSYMTGHNLVVDGGYTIW